MRFLLVALALLVSAGASADPVAWVVVVKPEDTEDAVFVATRVAVERVRSEGAGTRHVVEPGAYAHIEAFLTTTPDGAKWSRSVRPAGKKPPKWGVGPSVFGTDRKVLAAYQPWRASFPPSRPPASDLERPVRDGALVWDPLVLSATAAWGDRLVGAAPVQAKVLDVSTGEVHDVTLSPMGETSIREGEQTLTVARWQVSIPGVAAPVELLVHPDKGLVATRLAAMTAVREGFSPIYEGGGLGRIGGMGRAKKPRRGPR
jgi:hypothetical protein